LCKNPDLVAEVTVTAQEKIKADAAILFSDILLLVEPLGLKLDYVKGDGPSIQKPIRTSKDVDMLNEVKPEISLSYVLEGVRQTRRRLNPSIPLIGFAGAPFTVASYMIEGGSSKDFRRTKRFMREDAVRWKVLMRKITHATVKYLNAQVVAGVQAIQLFDSWAGALTLEEYKDFAAPFSKELFQGVSKEVSVIHFGTRTAPFLEAFSEAGGQVIGVDHRISLSEAWKRIGPGKAIQGNLDPEILLKDTSLMKKEVDRILAEAAGRSGHIFNLGHGVLPETPVENVKALVEMVHEYRNDQR
jgi:uroporphyrinogen decarboxylase